MRQHGNLPFLPLSAAQYGIWLGQQLDPASPAYWTAEAVELTGDLDIFRFETSLRQAIMECSTLHMRYETDEHGDNVRQTLHEEAVWTICQSDLSGMPTPWLSLLDWLRTDLAAVANLRTGPLFGTALIRLGPGHHVWTLRAHHIALDGFGYMLLAQRVAALYANPSDKKSLSGPAGLAAVIEEDQAYRQSSFFKENKAFWLARMNNLTMPPTLGKPAPAAHDVLRHKGMLPPDTLRRWQDAAANLETDWSIFVIAAAAAWLHRATGATDIVLGLPVMNRLGSVALAVPCMAMNIIPLRLAVSATASFADLVRKVAAELRSVRVHQRYRYEQLKTDMAITWPRRLFGPIINIMPFDRPLQFNDLQATSHSMSAGPVEDLAVNISVGCGSVRFDMEANPDSYGSAALARHHAALVDVLATVTADPFQQLDQLPAAPDAKVATLATATTAIPSILFGEALPDAHEPVLEAFLRHAVCTPDHIALEQEDDISLARVSVTYGELLLGVQTCADRLQARGLARGHYAAIMLPRSPAMITSLLAILWCGAAYVPLDSKDPQTRLATIIREAGISLAITVSAWAGLLDGLVQVCCMDENDLSEKKSPGLSTDRMRAMYKPRADISPGAPAYVIHTSGSTGIPNGVVIGHAALAHFVAAASLRYAITKNDRMLQFAPLRFDASVEEIFLSLCNGATLVLRTDSMLDSIPEFFAGCRRQRLTVLDLPTAFWHELAFAIGKNGTSLPPCVRLTIIGGEAALSDRVRRWRAATRGHSALLNTYGPTETTVICTSAELAGPHASHHDDDAISIGRPLPGTGIAIVDAFLQPVPAGETGELCVTGPTLANGYLNQPALSASRFVHLHALPDSPRAYRTGDLVCLQQDGLLGYLGRLDDEFKISGYRIDPAETETALLAYPGIEGAAVTGQTLSEGNKRLVAFLVTANMPAEVDLRTWLAGRLPAQAIPGLFFHIEKLPRNANGKIDRAILRKRAVQLSPSPANNGTPLERIVITVWHEVLGQKNLTPESDFFALGGQSLQAIQTASRLGTLLGREIQISALFRYPTVAALALFLDMPQGHAPPTDDPFSTLLLLQSGSGPALFCIHPAAGLAWCYRGLAAKLPLTPIYGLQATGASGPPASSIQDMVASYVAQIRIIQPHGPYRLLGWSSGGGIAHAMAAVLQQSGETIDLLAMMDSYPASIWEGAPPACERDALIGLLDVTGDSAAGLDGAPLTDDVIRARLLRPGSTLAEFAALYLDRLIATAVHSMHLYRQLQHPCFHGDLLFFHALRRPANAPDWRGWAPHVSGSITCIDVDSTHNDMSKRLPLAHIGHVLAKKIAGHHPGNIDQSL